MRLHPASGQALAALAVLAGLSGCPPVTGPCADSSACPNGQLCDANVSGACIACTADAECLGDAFYGADHICLSGQCAPGNCHGDPDCAGGQVCDADTHSCRACVDVTEDTRCGAGAACVSGVCTVGGCNDSTQCTDSNLCLNHRCGCAVDSTCGGGLCRDTDPGSSTVLACVPCADPADDAACVTGYGSPSLCLSGACTAATCRIDADCGGDICCGNSCTSNECCGTTDVTHCGVVQPGFVCSAGGSCVCPARSPGMVVVSAAGSDGTGNGSNVCPVRSIKRGLQLAAADPSSMVVVNIGAGTYDAANGETFPLVISRGGLSLLGAGRGGSQVINAGATTSLLRLDAALMEANGLSLTNTGAAASVVDAHASGLFSNVDFNCNPAVTPAGLLTSAAATVTFGPVGTISYCTVGADINAGATVVISAEVWRNGTGVRVSSGGVLNTQGGAKIFESTGVGVQFNDGAVTNATSVLNGAEVRNNGSHGVAITLNSRVKVRNSVIRANTGSGVHISGASALVDLGAIADPGQNTFNTTASPNGGVGVCNLSGANLNAVGNTWSQCPPSADVGCANGMDINANILAPSCTAQ